MIKTRKAGSFSLLFMGLIFAVVGGCVASYFGGDVTFTCQRSTNTCVLEKSNLIGSKESVARFPLSSLKSAEVESSKGGRTSKGRASKGRASKPGYRLVLQTTDSEIPFAEAFTPEVDWCNQTASSINSYLKSSDEILLLTKSNKLVRWFGYAFLAFGLLSFVSGAWRVIKLFIGIGSMARG